MSSNDSVNGGNICCFDGPGIGELQRLWRLKYPVPDDAKPYDRHSTHVASNSDNSCDACNVGLCQSPDQEIERIISCKYQFLVETTKIMRGSHLLDRRFPSQLTHLHSNFSEQIDVYAVIVNTQTQYDATLLSHRKCFQASSYR